MRNFAMTSVFSCQYSIILCPASFCNPRPNLPVIPGITWLPTFAFQHLWWKRLIFLLLVPKSLVGLHRTIHYSFFGISGWGTDLDYCAVAWFALEMSQDRSVIFEIAPKYCISDSFVDYKGYPNPSKGFLPTLVDIMVIWIKITHPCPF